MLPGVQAHEFVATESTPAHFHPYPHGVSNVQGMAHRRRHQVDLSSRRLLEKPFRVSELRQRIQQLTAQSRRRPSKRTQKSTFGLLLKPTEPEITAKPDRTRAG